MNEHYAYELLWYFSIEQLTSIDIKHKYLFTLIDK